MSYKDHAELYKALAYKASKPIKKDSTVGNAVPAELDAITRQHSDHVIAAAKAKNAKKHESFCAFMEQLVGGGGNEGNEQGVKGAATSSKTPKGLKLKYPKKPEEVVKPLANESSDDTLHSYDDQIRKVSKDLGQDVHLVGGPVRDALMGRKSKDTDMVTVGGLQNIHNKGWKNIKKDFPVFTHKDHPGVELALGRGEKKTGTGHSDFDWHEAPDLKTDLGRRDFTINAMAYHPDKGITDPHGGRQDIEKKTLKHVGAAFSDDALRTLRGARFASQLDFSVDPDTVNQFTKTNNELKNVSKERVRGEVEKAMATKNPSRFFKTLSQSKSLGHWFPEIEKTQGVPAGPPNKHPEGDTFNHSMHAVDYSAGKGHDAKTRMFALTHDLGKAETPKDQWPKHHGHETKTEPAKALVGRLGYSKGEVRDVENHVRHHMLPHAPKLRPGTVVDYYRGVKNIAGQHLDAVTADSNAKGLPDQGEPKSVTNLRGAFKAIKDTPIEPNTPVDKIKSKQAQSVAGHMKKQEDFSKFMNKWMDEDRAERLYQDDKHSGKMEKGNVIWRRVKHSPLHIKRVGEWPDEVPSRGPINKAMKHGYRQSVKRDIAKDPESV